MIPTNAPLLSQTYSMLYVECSPGLGRNNGRYADRQSKRLSKNYQSYRDFVWVAWAKAGAPLFHEGRVGIEIAAYWDRKRTLDFETAFADVDAIDKGTLDALHVGRCKCLDTDMRVDPLVLRKFISPKPHVEIFLWRC